MDSLHESSNVAEIHIEPEIKTETEEIIDGPEIKTDTQCIFNEPHIKKEKEEIIIEPHQIKMETEGPDYWSSTYEAMEELSYYSIRHETKYFHEGETLDECEKRIDNHCKRKKYRKSSLSNVSKRAKRNKDKRRNETEEKRQARLRDARARQREYYSKKSTAASESERKLDGYNEQEHIHQETTKRGMRKSIRLDAYYERIKKTRATETIEQIQARLESDRERKRLKRSLETPAEREARLTSNRERNRLRRESETPDQRQARKFNNLERVRFKRASETPAEREARLTTNCERTRFKRASETEAEREARLISNRERNRLRRASETAAQREARLTSNCKRARKKRSTETLADLARKISKFKTILAEQEQQGFNSNTETVNTNESKLIVICNEVSVKGSDESNILKPINIECTECDEKIIGNIKIIPNIDHKTSTDNISNSENVDLISMKQELFDESDPLSEI